MGSRVEPPPEQQQQRRPKSGLLNFSGTKNWDSDCVLRDSLSHASPRLQAIHIPGHGSDFSFALSRRVEDSARASLECIRQSRHRRTMESLGPIRYKLTVQATDESYETTRAKMAAASNAAKLNATKVIKESGPKVGRRIKVSGGGKSVVSRPPLASTAAKKPAPVARAGLLTVPSPHAYPVSSGSRAAPAVNSSSSSSNSNGNSNSGNKLAKNSSQKKIELKPDSRSPVPQANGYSDLMSHWAKKPTSPSVPEPASLKSNSSQHSSSDSGSSCSSQGVTSSPKSPDDRQKLKSEFNSQYAVYKELYAKLHRVSQSFWQLEEKLKNSVEGSEEWNVSSFPVTRFPSLVPLSPAHHGDHRKEVRGAEEGRRVPGDEEPRRLAAPEAGGTQAQDPMRRWHQRPLTHSLQSQALSRQRHPREPG